ncbi:MAG: hypothetical protein EAZ53_08295 [Bacteroidetes bacterium]|nr:MAG: hypothetical protein EAZ53_08295 [Bacteroidota bacterium]
MEYQKALNLKDKNLHLLGKYENGARIDEIAIIPTNSESNELFMKEYFRTYSSEEISKLFFQEDVEVVAIFNKKISINGGPLFKTNVLRLKEIQITV